MNETQAEHPASEELAASGAGELDPQRAAALQSHLAQCPACRERLAQLSSNRPPASQDTMTGRGRLRGERETIRLPRPTTAQATDSLADTGPPELADHGRYRVLARLGAGGMGVVYKAEHRLMERPVALKVISKQFLADSSAVERFAREVKAAARLSHPNIVTAHDAEHAGGLHFLVMEYVEGMSLHELVRQRGPLPVSQACACARDAALGLQHAHERGMIHRDIKPHNLMLTEQGQVKILDFGLARLLSQRRPEGSLTDSTCLMGTPDFVAPEQARDSRKADIRSDIYSLGCTLYYLLTGQPPFPEGSIVQKLAAHVRRVPPPLDQLRPEVPAALAHVVARMLAKDPAERFQTPADVAEALAACISGGHEPREGTGLALPVVHDAARTARPAPWRRPDRRVSRIALALSVVALGSSLLVVVRHLSSDRREQPNERAAPSANANLSRSLITPVNAKNAAPAAPLVVDDPAQGKVWRFDGTGGAITMTTAGFPVRGAERTLTAWIKVDELNSRETCFLCYGGVGNPHESFLLGADHQGKVFFSQWGEGLSGPNLELHRWYHIAVTLKAGLATLFLDGTSVGTGKVIVATSANSLLRIGYLDPARCLIGDVAEVAIAPVALRAEEVQALFRQNRQDAAKLPGVWSSILRPSGDVLARNAAPQEPLGVDDPVLGKVWRCNGSAPITASTVGFPTGSADRTMASWVKIDELNAPETCFLAYGAWGHWNELFYLGADRQGQVFFTQWGDKIAGPKLELGRWHHVAVTLHKGIACLYVDGVAASAPKGLTVHTAKGSLLQVGYVDPSRRLIGDIGEVLITGTVLTGEDLQALVRQKQVPKSSTDLLALVDPARHAVRGDWVMEKGRLLSDATLDAFLHIPYRPPAEYLLRIRAERRRGNDCLHIGLTYDTARLMLVMDGWPGNQTSGLDMIDGRRAVGNETSVHRSLFRNGQASEIVVVVLKNSIRATFDGVEIVHWKPDSRRLSLRPEMQVDGSGGLFVGTHSEFLISKFELGTISGQGQVLKAVTRSTVEPAIAPPSGLEARSDEWIDLLKLVEFPHHAVYGSWRKQGAACAVAADGQGFARLVLPLKPQGSYELEAAYSAPAGHREINFILPVASRACMLSAPMGERSRFIGLQHVNGRPDTARIDFRSRVTQRIAIKVEVDASETKAAISAVFDGKPVYSWSGPISQLSLRHDWLLYPLSLGVGVHMDEVLFEEVKLKVLTKNALRVSMPMLR